MKIIDFFNFFYKKYTFLSEENVKKCVYKIYEFHDSLKSCDKVIFVNLTQHLYKYLSLLDNIKINQIDKSITSIESGTFNKIKKIKRFIIKRYENKNIKEK